MNKQIFAIIVITLVMIPSSIFAQGDFDKLYEKYAGKDGFTSINISTDMFKFLNSMDMSDSSDEAKKTQNVMAQLEGLKMLVYDKPEGKVGVDFYKEINDNISMKDFVELMTVKDSDSDIKFLVKKSGKNSVSELLMIVKGEDEVLIMSMTGDIDMNTISDISNSLNMKGMDKLDKIND